jgi:malonyl-CoA O-methyltransferase
MKLRRDEDAQSAIEPADRRAPDPSAVGSASPLVEAAEELPVQAGYAAWASCYDDDGNPLIALEGPAVLSWLGPLSGVRSLDLGCGTGRHTLALAEGGASVTALDLTPEMLARARQKLQDYPVGWVRHALPQPLPFPEFTFDRVVLGLVAEHIADLDALLRESARVLAPGGRCILSALHPERTAEGQRARFIDPETGLRRPITTYHRTLDDYRDAADRAGLTLLGEETLVVPHALAERLPRAARYVGRPLGWVACWTKTAAANS